MEAWSGISLTFGTSTGDLKQLYPTWAPVGAVPATANAGDQIRTPSEGTLFSIQVKTDGTNGGSLEIWDINGHDSDIDVSSLDVITNAELAVLEALGKAKLIYDQNFAADASTPPPVGGVRGFTRGLAARFVGAAGACELNLTVKGGFNLKTQAGDK